MAKTIYRCSLKKTIGVVFVIMFGSFVLYILAINGNDVPPTAYTIKAATLIFLALTLVVVNMLTHVVKLTNTTIIYNNFLSVSHIPVKNIIGVGLPKQNWLASVYNAYVYILYDNPNQPGEDKYINLRIGIFGEGVLAKLVNDIVALRPDIMLDSKMESFVKTWAPAPDTATGFWHFLTKKR